MSKWIKKGDTVLVIAGNEKGKRGSVVARRDEKVIIQGINIRKKHVKRQQKVGNAGIIDIECPVHISNVCLCDADGNRIRVKVKTEADRKELYYLRDGKEVLFREI